MGGLILFLCFFVPEGGLDGRFGIFGEVAVEGVTTLVVAASVAEEEALGGETLLGSLPFLVRKTEDFCLIAIHPVLPIVIELHNHLCLRIALS